ncbi:MAG: hypothetical protein JST87_11875 [Bacteroidetes bacterium]|nr:hypothetical protein [Bacteroidota bacterium]
MKKLLTLVVFVSNIALAQINNDSSLPQKLQLSPFNLPKKFSTDLFDGSPSFFQSGPTFKNREYQNADSTGTLRLFSCKRNDGSIQNMQPDNMPCLAPDMSNVEKMHVSKFENMHAKDPMPNSMKKQRVVIIPDKK